jgi:nucleoside-diphosphate-sugar epimerase
MKVLVTGVADFFGSHLTERFVELRYQVVAFTNYNSENDWGWLDSPEHKNFIKVITRDIRDFYSSSFLSGINKFECSKKKLHY